MITNRALSKIALPVVAFVSFHASLSPGLMNMRLAEVLVLLRAWRADMILAT